MARTGAERMAAYRERQRQEQVRVAGEVTQAADRLAELVEELARQVERQAKLAGLVAEAVEAAVARIDELADRLAERVGQAMLALDRLEAQQRGGWSR